MVKSPAKQNQKAFANRFVSFVEWFGIGLILTALLWIVAMVALEAFEQWSR